MSYSAGLLEDAVTWVTAQDEQAQQMYMTVVLAVWNIMCLPSTLMECVPGYLFGFRQGTVVSVVGKSLASWLSILLARYVVKRSSWRDYLFNKFTMLRAIEVAVRKNGFPIIVMVRLLALPLLVKNYGLGILDGVPVWHIMAASTLTGIPFAMAWSYLGSTASTLVDIYNGKSASLDLPPWAMGLGAFAVLSMWWVIFTRVREAYASIVAEETQPESDKDK